MLFKWHISINVTNKRIHWLFNNRFPHANWRFRSIQKLYFSMIQFVNDKILILKRPSEVSTQNTPSLLKSPSLYLWRKNVVFSSKKKDILFFKSHLSLRKDYYSTKTDDDLFEPKKVMASSDKFIKNQVTGFAYNLASQLDCLVSAYRAASKSITISRHINLVWLFLCVHRLRVLLPIQYPLLLPGPRLSVNFFSVGVFFCFGCY